MKATAHFKAVVLLSVCLAGAAAVILTHDHDHAGAPAAGTPGSVADDGTIQTVTVVGKRMTSEEKALYDRQNNRFATRKAAGRDNG